MLNVNIICVGSLKEGYWRDAISEYVKRLGGFCKFGIIELPEERLGDNPALSQIDAALRREGERILKAVKCGSKLIALCIEGKAYSSEQLSELIEKTAVDGLSSIYFIIGSSYGLHDDVKQKADVKMSMSTMTFPHQLARVMLTEQIYRAFKISQGGKYHK